jgi:hypothetical protein
MSCRMPLFFVFLLLFGSAICHAQTATCTNWKYIHPTSPWLAIVPSGINRWGTVVGSTYKSTGPHGSSVTYGYVHYSNGTFKTYMAPNASNTYFTRRNALGVTVGAYTDSTFAQHQHGLVLSGSSMATVDYPGATDTRLNGINYWGTIVGNYYDSSHPEGGAFKLKNGVFTSIFYPGSVSTAVASISDKGVIVGRYHDYNPPYIHGFTLTNGVYKTLDNPKGSGTGGQGTALGDINASGVIVGLYTPQVGGTNGFIYINGTFKDVSVPNFGLSPVDAINGYSYVVGTYGSGINAYTAHCQ